MKKSLFNKGMGLFAGLSLLFANTTVTLAQPQIQDTNNFTQQKQVLEQKVEKSFPNKEIKDIKNFRQYSEDILKIVINKKGLKINEKIPQPKIITEDEITLKEFNENLGYSPDFFNGIFPYYVQKHNKIIVLNNSKLDTLAHEFVHYFQAKYQKINIEEIYDPGNSLESEAVTVQKWFKEKYLK